MKLISPLPATIEGHRSNVSENREPRRIFRTKKKEVAGRRKMHNEAFSNLHSSDRLTDISIVKSISVAGEEVAQPA
jgi:hypothetical protein